MGKLTWQTYGENFYEHGVDRVVAYPEGGVGVSWSGVSSISEKNDATVDGYYLDGLKYVQVPSYGEYGASLDAYAIPSDLNLCLGFAQLSPGLFATNQRRRSFDLSYRTLVGNEDSDRIAYKLHLVYNAVATPSFGGSATIKDVPEPATYSLELSTIPPEGSVPNLRPTAHLILDSRYVPPDVMEDVERILYGTDILWPRLPSPNEILMLTQAPPYTVSWDGTSNASASRLVRRTSELVARNLATNPSFEATSSTFEVYRNLATNPGFEATSGTVEVRRNRALSPMPSASLWTASWGTGGAGAITYSATGGPGGVGYKQMVWSTPGTGAPRMQIVAGGVGGIPVVAGETVPLSVDVACSGRVKITWDWYADGTWLSAGSGPTITPSADIAAPTRLSVVTGAAPATATRLVVFVAVVPVDVVVGTTLRATRFLAGDAGPYFDGATSPDSDLAASWTGTANASASILTGAAIEGMVTARCVAIRSTRWKKSGTHSMRLIPTGAPGDPVAYAYYSPAGGSRTGKTDTLLATVHLEAPLANGYGARMYLEGGVGPGNTANIANAAGDQELRVTSARPGQYTASFFVIPAARGNGDVWVDNTATIEGNYTGEWFDGSTSPDSDLTPAWTGTANASASVLTGVGVAGASPNNTLHISSSGWSSSGNGSLRLIPNGTSNDTSVTVAGNFSSLSGLGVTLSPGKTYTVLATSRLADAQTGTLNGAARRIAVHYNTTYGWTGATVAVSPITPNSPGTHEHRVAFSLPSDAVWCAVRLMNGAAVGNGDVWWDDFAIIEGNYTGPWFDGNNLPD